MERARQDAGEGADASSAAIDRRVASFGGAATHAAVTIDGKVTVWPIGPGGSSRLNTVSAAVDMVAWDGNTHVVYSATDGAIYRQLADGTLPASLVAHMPCPGGPVTSSDGRLACSDGRGGIIATGVNGTNQRTLQTSQIASLPFAGVIPSSRPL